VKCSALLAALVLAADVPCLAQTPPHFDWDKAAREIVRLPPSAFAKTPASVVVELQKLGCTVPQTYERPEPHNLVTGSFGSSKQRNWAALCSRGGRSSLVVVWGGPQRCPAFSGDSPDKDALQGTLDDRGFWAGYSVEITPLPPGDIKGGYYHKVHHPEGARMPPIDHDAIGHEWLGKSMVALYCHKGVWFTLGGEGH